MSCPAAYVFIVIFWDLSFPILFWNTHLVSCFRWFTSCSCVLSCLFNCLPYCVPLHSSLPTVYNLCVALSHCQFVFASRFKHSSLFHCPTLLVVFSVFFFLISTQISLTLLFAFFMSGLFTWMSDLPYASELLQRRNIFFFKVKILSGSCNWGHLSLQKSECLLIQKRYVS